MKLKWSLFLVLALAVGIAFYFREAALRNVSSYLSPPQEEPVPTLRLEKRNYRVAVAAGGQLTGLQTTTLSVPRAANSSLKIGWMVEEGRIVQPGQVVVRFDNTDAQLALEQNENTVATYRERIGKTESEAESQAEILGVDRQSAELEYYFASNQVRKDDDIFSQWEIQESIISAALAEYKKSSVETKAGLQKELSDADLKILSIEKKKAQTEVNQAQQTLSSLEITTPVGGVVLYRRRGFDFLEMGAEVWPGQPILDIADLRQFKGDLNVPETEIAGIEADQPVEIALNALPSRRFEAILTKVSTVATQLSRKDPRKFFTCTVVLDVSPEVMEQLKPGMRLSGEIETSRREDAFVLPKNAVFKEDDHFFVFVKKEAAFEKEKVEIVDSDHGFYVIEGVAEGQFVSLRHPFEKDRLHLPDFSAPSTATQNRRFVVFF